MFRAYQQQIAESDQRIATQLATLTGESGATSLPVQKRFRAKRRNEPAFDARQVLHRMTGVDLTRIDGLDGHSALKIIGKIGTDMSRWKTVNHFTSCWGLCSGNKQVERQVAERPDQALQQPGGRLTPPGGQRSAPLAVGPGSLPAEGEGPPGRSQGHHGHRAQARETGLHAPQTGRNLRRPRLQLV